MQFSDDELISYLLGDAEPDLATQLESELAHDPDLLDRLSHLRGVLGHLDSLGGIYEPPGDLVESTMGRIEEDSVALSSFGPAEGLEATGTAAYQGRVDSFVLSCSLVLICCLVLPAIINVRFVARKNQCMQNMAANGQSLINYAINDPSGRMPFVGDDERTSFAGVYSVHLVDRGYPVEISNLRCPSMRGTANGLPGDYSPAIPNLVELGQIALSELVLLKRYLGGNYAYNVGVEEGGVRVAPLCEGRSNFAILSDAPTFVQHGEQFVAHDGRGLNILYEDGHVEFVCLESRDVFPSQLADHPFRNLNNVHAAGLNQSDAFLAPSHFSPSAGDKWQDQRKLHSEFQ